MTKILKQIRINIIRKKNDLNYLFEKKNLSLISINYFFILYVIAQLSYKTKDIRLNKANI